MASPLFGLLKEDSDFCWTDQCQEAFEELEEKLTTTPVLRRQNWAFPFHIHSYESNKVVEVALGKLEGNMPYTIYFISKNLSKVELTILSLKKSSCLLCIP